MDRIRELLKNTIARSRHWRLLTARKIIYLPHILTKQEKRILTLLFTIAVLTGIGFFTRVYIGVTHPVPGVGGSYTEGIIGSPSIINPIYASRDADRDLARLIFSGLLTYDGAGAIRPDLAERYDITPDGKTYTFFLRKNAVWHDGIPVGADDVVFTIKRIQDPLYKSPLRANWQGVDVEKIDDTTVRFSLHTAYAPFIENLTQGILPKHLWEHVGHTQSLLHELNLNPIGSGPYEIKRFKSQSNGSLLWYTVQRNPHYYQTGPYISEITLMFFATESEMIASLHKGDIRGFSPVSAANTKDLDQGRFGVLTLATPRIFSIFFHTKGAPGLDDVRVREAIAHALDKKKIALVAASGAIPGETLVPFAHTAEDGLLSFDPDRARQLMDRAGWKDLDGDGIRDKKITGKKKAALTSLRLTIATGDSPELDRAASLIRDMLRNIGIDITVEKKSFAELESSVIRPRAFEMLLFGQVYGYEPDLFAFWHSSQVKDPGLNVALFSNKKADKILESARRITDTKARDQKYAEFSAIAGKEIPAIPLYSQLYLYLLPRDIQGVDISQIALPSDRFNTIANWYLATRRVFF